MPVLMMLPYVDYKSFFTVSIAHTLPLYGAGGGAGGLAHAFRKIARPDPKKGEVHLPHRRHYAR